MLEMDRIIPELISESGKFDMQQDAILSKLKKLAETRGALRTFCSDHKLSYLKVWKFTNGKVKSLQHDFGLAIADALRAHESNGQSEKPNA